MSINGAQISRLLQRLLKGGAPDFAAAASERTVLHPAETVTTPPAIFSDDALDRIESVSPWCTWDSEVGTARGGTVEHAATEALVFEDVGIGGPFIYKAAGKERHGFGPEKLFLGAGVENVHQAEAHLLTNWPAAEFFGQYLRDNYPLELIPRDDKPRISMVTRDYHHNPGYRDVFGLPHPQIVQRGRVGRLTVYRDFSQNSFKVARYRDLRARLRKAIARDGDAPTGVYLKRGSTGERRILTNEDAVEARLKQMGFDIVVPSELSSDEVARRTLDAPLIVSVEGSHLCHSIFSMADDAAFLVLQPPDRFAMPYKEYADCMGMRFAFIVGTRSDGGFTIDPGEVEQMLEQLQ